MMGFLMSNQILTYGPQKVIVGASPIMAHDKIHVPLAIRHEQISDLFDHKSRS